MERQHDEGQPDPSNPADPSAIRAEEDVYILDESGMVGAESPEQLNQTVSRLVANADAPAPRDAALPTAAASDEYVLAEETPAGMEAAEEPEAVTLGAADGEVGAVEPPAGAVGEDGTSLDGEESAEGEMPEGRVVRFPRWVPIAAAAAALLAVGGAFYFTMGGPEAPPDGATQVAAKPNDPAKGGVAKGPIVRKAPLNPDTVPPAPGVENPTNVHAPDPAPQPEPNVETAAVDPNAPKPEAQPKDPVNPEVAVADPSSAQPPAGSQTPASDPNAKNPANGDKPAGQPTAASLARGTEVIVRLRNGNLFNGKLDRFTPEEARLRVPKGIIEFAVRDVDVIVPLSQAPKKAGPQAVVQLRNGNKLAGRLTDENPDRLVLLVGGAEITIPKNAVASLEYRSPLGLVLGDEVDAKDKPAGR